MVDLSKHTAPKSDQLNADDLIGGPMTVRITDVREMGGADQPIAISFEGDNGKPYKPCKSMMRALMFVWGPDGSQYIGRSIRLWRDPSVTWGGEEIGGIRISHMSDMREPMEFPLTATRGKRKLYRVEPLEVRQRKSPAEIVEEYCGALKGAETMSDLMEIVGGERATKLKAALEKNNATDLLERMRSAENAERQRIDPPAEEDDDDGLGDGVQESIEEAVGDGSELDDDFPGDDA